jgi:hypothetical protein
VNSLFCGNSLLLEQRCKAFESIKVTTLPVVCHKDLTSLLKETMALLAVFASNPAIKQQLNSVKSLGSSDTLNQVILKCNQLRKDKENEIQEWITKLA